MPTSWILLFRFRIAEVTGRNKSPNEFRLVCYNLLAGMYSRRESARKFFFPHCPAPYLDCNYRYPLIHRELIAYQADILCLQEVDNAHFHQRLCHILREAGDYEGCFVSKLYIKASHEMETLTEVQSIDRSTGKVRWFIRHEFIWSLPSLKLDNKDNDEKCREEGRARFYNFQNFGIWEEKVCGTKEFPLLILFSINSNFIRCSCFLCLFLGTLAKTDKSCFVKQRLVVPFLGIRASSHPSWDNIWDSLDCLSGGRLHRILVTQGSRVIVRNVAL